MDFIGITVGVIQSRPDKVANACFNSINKQVYPSPNMEAIVIDNKDKKKSIGKCFNEIVKKAKFDWVLFVGDDDFISPTYLFNLAVFTKHNIDLNRKFVSVTTDVTYIGKGAARFKTEVSPTGMWRKDYLLKNPFDEELERYVDTDLFIRTNENKKAIIHDSTNAGYYYLQHTENVSGNLFQLMNRVKVLGHKRSGNAYLCHLLNKNFFHKERAMRYAAGHELLRDIKPNMKYLYIIRNESDTLDSLYKYRGRQGLDVDSKEEFLETKYKDMKKTKKGVDVTVVDKDNTRHVDNIVKDLWDINETPVEWLKHHKYHHHTLTKLFDNILIVDYDELQRDFKAEMNKINDFLGLDKKEFENINHKVGYFIKE